MIIDPDIFRAYHNERIDGGIGLMYPECPIGAICAYVTIDGEPLAEPRCKYFEEPPAGRREPECKYHY